MKAFCIKGRVAACADQYISVPGLFDESRDWSRDKSMAWSRDKRRAWNSSRYTGICWNGVRIVRGNELKSRVKNGGESREWNGVMTTQETTQQTTQETTQRTTQRTTQQTTQQITWNTVRWEMGLKKYSMHSCNEGNLVW